MNTQTIIAFGAAIMLATITLPLQGSAQSVSNRNSQMPVVISPEVSSDRHITLRLYAPNARSVHMTNDIPENGPVEMTENANGVWEASIGPIEPGAYQYHFDIDGVSVTDPCNSSVGELHDKTTSLVYVPGALFMDTQDVAHGAVSSVTYYSSTLRQFRRMHVYTPPGYDQGEGKFPVLYLLHGAGDTDDLWTSLGRAGFILDNLIAAKKAKPMVLVMPAGHTRRNPSFSPGSGASKDEFVEDFLNEILPYVDNHYRVYTESSHRAIAGVSMGGGQTLNIAIAHLGNFGYVGVYSAGIFGISNSNPGSGFPSRVGMTWEEQHADVLDNLELKKGLKLLWFRTGKKDTLLGTTRATVDMLKKHGFEPDFEETQGGHNWSNWRIYLNEFAPQLFQ